MRPFSLSRTLLILLLCAVVFTAFAITSDAQVPKFINYQGRLTDTDGNPVADGEYLVTFTIWSDSTSTASPDRKWISPDCPVLVINGLFNWQLGSREGLQPWTIANDSALWLGIKVGDDPELAPRTRLCAAPYAFGSWRAEYSAFADSAFNVMTCAGGWTQVSHGPTLQFSWDSVAIGPLYPSARLDVDGDVQMTGFKMPTGASDGHVLTSDGSGNGTWQAASSQAQNACAGIENLTVDPAPKVRIIFPITFSNAGNVKLAASAIATTASTGSGFPARIVSTVITETYADLTLQCWNGSSYVDMTLDDIVQVSWTAIER
ncbi:MAG: hypothetical protein JSU65_04875 [Candidatus Zixiibacteriota bacterium]|nr:MAG: hypothetical protein JSU65_04875 [candidate division Zixibacteria bacterium]